MNQLAATSAELQLRPLASSTPSSETLPSPATGPRFVFLSGGTALRGTCRALTPYTERSIHLVTPFDSGGSSATLRELLDIPAVGDIRNRLLSLCHDGSDRADGLIALLGYRLPYDRPAGNLARMLDELTAGLHPLLIGVAPGVKKLVRTGLSRFRRDMPRGFDLNGASVGNLVLSGLLLQLGSLRAAIDTFSSTVGVRGTVRPIVEGSFHLAARLSDGRTVVGQHRLTGKHSQPLAHAIEDLWLVRDLDGTTCLPPVAAADTRDALESADLICLPIGSFWTSVAANLLPRGVGESIAASACRKVYVPNTVDDPEQLSLSIAQATEKLMEIGRRDAGRHSSPTGIINTVLLDAGLMDSEGYPHSVDAERLKSLGVRVERVDLVGPDRRVDGAKLAAALRAVYEAKPTG